MLTVRYFDLDVRLIATVVETDERWNVGTFRYVTEAGFDAGGKAFCQAVTVIGDHGIYCTTPEYVGYKLDVVAYIEGQDSGDSGRKSFTYAPPAVNKVTPSVNADQSGGKMMVIFGEYLGIPGQAQEVWVGAGPCAAVAIEVNHNMVTCLYPPGE